MRCADEKPGAFSHAELSTAYESGKRPTRGRRMRGSEPSPNLNASSPMQGTETTMQTSTGNATAAYFISMLKQGYIQSYIDLFYLMHENDGNTLAAFSFTGLPMKMQPENPCAETSTIIEKLHVFREGMVQAEAYKRKGDSRNAFEAYKNIAQHCSMAKDHKTMIFYYEKCFELVDVLQDSRAELSIVSELGVGYQALRDLETARAYQERHVEIAKRIEASDREKKKSDILRETDIPQKSLTLEAMRQLGKVYMELAGEEEKLQRYETALELYKRREECADQTNETLAAEQAQFRIGLCHIALGQPSQALEFLELFQVACQNSENLEDESAVCAAFATAFEHLGDHETMIEYLKRYLEIATRCENIQKQADACRRLGLMHTREGEFTAAREMHERHFALISVAASMKGDGCKSIDTGMMDRARMNLGAARANEKLQTLISFVKLDLDDLLTWKQNRRMPVQDA